MKNRKAEHGATLISNHAVNNGLSNANPYCTGMSATNVTVNQAFPVPNGAINIVATQVVACCTYQFKFLPTLPGFSVPNKVTLKGTAVFGNLY